MSKIKNCHKSLSVVITLSIILVAGFMGVHKYDVKERSLTIIEDESVVTSVQADSQQDSKATAALDIDAKAAVLIDGNSGKVLYAQNEKKHLPPASVTKVMTLLLIMEGCEDGKISLQDKVTVSQRAASMGGSQMYMEAGEQHSVEELLKGVIMVSANDGCVALAEHMSGSVESFVDDMNKRAKQLGLSDSNFINTNGLPVADHYSCAYDIGIISSELMKHEEAHKWFTAWQEDIKVGLPGKESKFTLTNTNKLIRTYNGAIGTKTGFTQDAGYCLSGAALRGDTMMIGVVLGCKTSEIRFNEMRRLLDHGFANYETIIVADSGERVKKIKIEKGETEHLYAVTGEKAGITAVKGSGSKLEKEIVIEKNIKLPVKKGDTVGSMIIHDGDNKHEYKLVADRTVKKADFKTTYIRMMKKLV